MKVSGKAYIHLQLTDFPVPDEAIAAIRAEVGEVSPARILSEYLYRLLKDTWLGEHVIQTSAVPEQWTED